MELAVYSLKGEDTGRKVTLSDAIFGLEVNEHVMYLDVKQYLANQRQGTHKSKERAEISGTTKKAEEAERYRWRPCRLHEITDFHWWGPRIRTTSA